MVNKPNQPGENNAVLGGQAQPPLGGVVLGGLEGVRQQLATGTVEQQIAVLI